MLLVIMFSKEPDLQKTPGPAGAATSYGIPLEALLSLDCMEGSYTRPLTEIKRPHGRPPRASALPGYLLGLTVTASAYLIHYLPFPPFRVISASGVRYPLSAAILAMLAGIAVRNLVRLPAGIIENARSMPRRMIAASIVLTGAGLNLAAITSIGVRTLLITLACLTVAMASSVWLGAVTRLFRKTAILIGAGTAICGTSAIVAVAPLIRAEDQDMLLAIGTVNILGLVFMFAMPLLGSLMNLSDQAFGVWAGTSIHAVPQVLAAAFSYSQPAGALATLVKLVRVALLAPLIFVLGIWHSRQAGAGKTQIHYHRLVPAFVWGFLLLASLNTAELLPVLQFRFGFYPTSGLLTNASELLLAISMAAMGLEVNIVQFSRVGARALLVGTLSGLLLLATSLLLIRLYL
ncbi:MAG: putative sulfate exporter family transporter [Bryobacterales bacterium]|nr:putative sulfate exporter family transporter [Bryobacterales bacterium]